ncbi:hypothetical protein FSP39_011547 [Pinctada imbricata]|uniref:G-protein coupled receptors family 3 profile domain-containing protein n=1 Tax=Pinctada imbricata TaxID=66713 RepID=A0AA88XVA3_PINIB|nr:hypothetical protein FSP39_011547 [Pinctada imbricata]
MFNRNSKCQNSKLFSDTTIAQEALEYVSAVESRTSCNDGTSNTLNLQFDTSVWSIYTEPAIRTANLLTDILITNNGTLDSLSDEMFFTLVRNNIRGASVIFGSAIAIELGVYGKYPKFSPYAYEKNGTIFSHDIAINYDYLNGETEWYEAVKIKTWDGVHFAADEINYRSGNVLLPMEIVSRPTAVLSDGHWTKPYYDCGGGDIWMVTYSSPIFDINDTTNEAEFRGVATIDIELTNIDINQCEPDETSSGALDIFRGTHKCQPTTTCVFTAGLGFTRGAYNCHCQNGYYHPSTTHQYFLGMTVENHYANRSLEDGMFQCLRCAPGCTTCVDSSPCLFETNVVLRSILLIMAILTLVGIVLTSVMTYYYRETKVIKSGSTSFLQLMCLGSSLMCAQLFLMFPDASEVLCSIIPWFFHTGFCLMYVALLLKTWRISVIFRVGTFKRVHLPDKVVLQRMLPAVGIMTAYLVAWTATDTERTITLTTSDDKLKFKICSASWWYYAIHGGEALLLLFGVYLCFTVRKAPANFNESKYITWSVYNAIILGSFILIIT